MTDPSQVAPETSPAVTVAAQTARALPVALDPAYVRAIATVDATGQPQRWAGGAFHHCLGPEVDRAVVEPILTEMTALTGIPRTEAGPCNVTWSAEYGKRDHSYAEISGTPSAIVSARVLLYQPDERTARHEAGHVLGFQHSPNRNDLMNAGPRVDYFSADELAVLAWIYGR